MSHVANILAYLGPKLGLAPEGEAQRLFAHGLQLTITDFVLEVHDTHHPISTDLYYEDQKREAKARTAAFLTHRVPKYLGYFERVLNENPSGPAHAVGGAVTTVDLSLFQIWAGMGHAFPLGAFAGADTRYPALASLAAAVAERPNLARVEGFAHLGVEVPARLLPAAFGHAGDDRDGPVCRAGRDLRAHRSAGARVDRVPEPLERGLPGSAENITDLPPAMTGRARPVDGLLQRLAGCGGQVPGRRQGFQREAAAATGDRVREPVHVVKIVMTMARCQVFLHARSAGGIPPAPRRAPASSVTISPSPALTLLRRQLAAARLARRRSA